MFLRELNLSPVGRPLCVETLLVVQGCALTSGGGTDTLGLGQREGVADGQAEHGVKRGQRVQAGVRLHL